MENHNLIVQSKFKKNLTMFFYQILSLTAFVLISIYVDQIKVDFIVKNIKNISIILIVIFMGSFIQIMLWLHKKLWNQDIPINNGKIAFIVLTPFALLIFIFIYLIDWHLYYIVVKSKAQLVSL